MGSIVKRPVYLALSGLFAALALAACASSGLPDPLVSADAEANSDVSITTAVEILNQRTEELSEVITLTLRNKAGSERPLIWEQGSSTLGRARIRDCKAPTWDGPPYWAKATLDPFKAAALPVAARTAVKNAGDDYMAGFGYPPATIVTADNEAYILTWTGTEGTVTLRTGDLYGYTRLEGSVSCHPKSTGF